MAEFICDVLPSFTVDDLLLLRPPPRELLERGPPPSVRDQLAAFDKKIATSTRLAEELARGFCFNLPAR